jgi:hypothetical protein
VSPNNADDIETWIAAAVAGGALRIVPCSSPDGPHLSGLLGSCFFTAPIPTRGGRHIPANRPRRSGRRLRAYNMPDRLKRLYAIAKNLEHGE